MSALTLLAAACSGGDAAAEESAEQPATEPQGVGEDDRDDLADAPSEDAPTEDVGGDPDEPADEAADDDLDTAEPVVPGPPPPVELSSNEVLPNAKRSASEVVQQLTTYDPDDGVLDILERIVGEEISDGLVETVEPLYHEGAWSRGEIVYPQLGGSTPTDTSVMVVVRQTVGLPHGEERVETRTIDVRLTLVDDAWAFASIEDAGGVPVPRPDDLPDAAVAVLDDERIELPDSAIWDIHAGRTEVELLEVMTKIAERHRYGVVVLETGHPIHVFGTDVISTHLYGRAVDIYHLDGTLIVDDREQGSAAHELTQWLFEQPVVTKIGAPWALDGFGGRSFTDIVHQDHLHVEAGRRPPGPPAHREDLAVDRAAGS